MTLLVNSFESGTSGTTLTGGSGGNTAGTGINYVDSVSIGTGCTLAFSNVEVMHGSLACKIATGTTAAASYLEWSTSLGTVTKHYGRLYIYLTAAPGNSDAFIQFQSGSATFACGIQLSTSRQLVIQTAGFTSLHTFTTVIPLSTWYRLEWELTSSATVGTITLNLYVGDSTSATESYTSGAVENFGPSCDAVLVGWTGSHASQPAVYVDDYGLSTTGFLGPNVGVTHSGTITLAGIGTLGPAIGGLAGTSGLSGIGTLTASTNLIPPTGAMLSGIGTLSGASIGLQLQSAGLSGVGTLGIIASGINTVTGGFSGIGTLSTQVMLSYSAILTGSGTLSLIGRGGVAFASPGVSPAYMEPGTSQVSVAAQGSTDWRYLGSIGVMTALTYSFVCPGGADQMTCTIMVPATYRTQMFNPGWQVRITRGGHIVWTGKLDEPVPTTSGWNLTGVGTGNIGQDYLAIYTDTWPASEPDESINAAIARGLPWTNPGVGTPTGAWYGQSVDSGAQTITDLLNLICTRGGLTWYVNSQPGGIFGNDLNVFPLPNLGTGAVPNRILTCTQPVPRTLGGDINTIFIRYTVSAASSTSSGSQTTAYGVTSVVNAQSVAQHGTLETYIDLSSAGVMTAAQAQSVGNYVLSIYQRASFAGPFQASYGELLNSGGAPIDPGTDQAGTVMRLILTDYGYGGEVVPAPIVFLVGSYSWDDFAQVATISPFQTIDTSLTGMLSTESTILTPITTVS